MIYNRYRSSPNRYPVCQTISKLQQNPKLPHTNLCLGHIFYLLANLRQLLQSLASIERLRSLPPTKYHKFCKNKQFWPQDNKGGNFFGPILHFSNIFDQVPNTGPYGKKGFLSLTLTFHDDKVIWIKSIAQKVQAIYNYSDI